MGLTYARFSVGTVRGFGPIGLAPDGEVEDHALNIAPTAVELLSFIARPEGWAILVQWETASEIDNAGFNLYLATSLGGERSQLNGDLIPARCHRGVRSVRSMGSWEGDTAASAERFQERRLFERRW